MTELSGLKVFLVEDEGVIALLIEDMLQDLGCEIAATAANLAEAREIAATAEIELAVLDVNVDGQPIFPVAKILRDRQIPFVFSTGYGVSGLTSEFDGAVVLGKPFSKKELQETMSRALKR